MEVVDGGRGGGDGDGGPFSPFAYRVPVLNFGEHTHVYDTHYRSHPEGNKKTKHLTEATALVFFFYTSDNDTDNDADGDSKY